MTCQNCGKKSPLTYRNARRGVRSMCGPCVLGVEPYPVIAWQGWVVRR